MQHYTVYFIWKLLYMFRVVPPPIIRSANNCIYSIWYLSHRYCYLPLSWNSWNWFECAVGGVLICFCFDVVTDVSTVSMAIDTVFTSATTSKQKQISTPLTAHSNQFQLFHDIGR